MTLEALAARAGVSYQYLSGVETGQKNFTLQVLEALSNALDLSVEQLVALACGPVETTAAPLAQTTAPTLDPAYLRPAVPLPEGLTVNHLTDAVNRTLSIIHKINRNMIREVGKPLQGLIQGNNFSGLVSNIFGNAMDQCTPYKHNHDQKYPDLINKQANQGAGEGLEVKTTINIGKGGESHNGHSGWHVVACYQFLESGDIVFVHIMFAKLIGHMDAASDWKYIGSRVNNETGSRRTETYTTNLKGTTKLRDGSVYFDKARINIPKWQQERAPGEATPSWSIFRAENHASPI